MMWFERARYWCLICQTSVASCALLGFEGNGQLRATLEAKGRPIGALDTLIASHALSLKATVVTYNTPEFLRIDRIWVENWIDGSWYIRQFAHEPLSLVHSILGSTVHDGINRVLHLELLAQIRSSSGEIGRSRS